MRSVVGYLLLGLTLAIATRAAAADPLQAPTGLSPADGEDVRLPRPTLSWSEVPGAAGYRITWSDGSGGVARTAEAGRNSWTFTEDIPGESHVRWMVAAIGADGQAGPQSQEADFWVGRDNVAPEPATEFAASPAEGGANLTWKASPSADLAGYFLYERMEGGTYSNPERLGRVTSARVGSLQNGIAYDFMLTAIDASGNESVGVVATVRPATPVMLKGKGYPTIQAAVDAAAPGETVELGAATFLEGVSLPPGVSLHGAGPGLTVIDAAGFPAGVTLEASDASDPSRSTISNLTIRGGASGVWGGVANVRLENVVICRVNGPGVKTDGGLLDIARVTIAHCDRDGIDTAAGGTVTDSLILRNGGVGVVGHTPDALRIAWSDLYDNLLGGTVGVSAGPGLLSAAAQFENEAQDDYRVLAGDPTVDAGDPASPYAEEPDPSGARVNAGAFGNTPWATPTLAPAAGTRIETGSGGGGDSKSGKYCVVATAAFGSPDQSSVAALRAFRDRVLRQTQAGSEAVTTYERAAAPVARQVGKSEVLRAVFRSWIR